MNVKTKSLNILVSAALSTEYSKWVFKTFGEDSTIIVYDPDNYTPCDVLLLTGGSDVNPKLYRESEGKYTHINNDRDVREKGMCLTYSNTPKLGICRGAQFLTVLSEGRLIQHVNGHNTPHNIQTSFEMADGHFKSYLMSSSHHQMMYPYGLSESEYNLLAWSEYFYSSTYLDGKNNEIELPEEFLEPEIVFYPKTRSLCIQGHPEYSEVPEETNEFILNLIKTFLLNE